MFHYFASEISIQIILGSNRKDQTLEILGKLIILPLDHV